MEKTQRSVTNEGITGPYCLLLVLAVIGMVCSLYLTNHYMEIKFPQDLAATSACDINSFFNCDAATYSPLSNLFGLPIAVFGILFCANLIASCLFPRRDWEQANHSLAWVNVVGCLVLFSYTLLWLKSICPFCMGYWLLSIAIVWLLWKKGLPPAIPGLTVMLIQLTLALVILGGFSWNIYDRQKSSGRLAFALFDQFKRRPSLKEPTSPHKVYMSTQNFQDAPLRISTFSDFQCPSCLTFAENIKPLIKRYRGKINIQYLFYPLDHNCNDAIKRPLHPLACQTALLAHCAGEQFVTIHDEIFATQDTLTQTWIDQRADELGIRECKDNQQALDFVKAHIQQGNDLEVTSTPTLVVNGKMIPGGIPLEQLSLLFDQILKP